LRFQGLAVNCLAHGRGAAKASRSAAIASFSRAGKQSAAGTASGQRAQRVKTNRACQITRRSRAMLMTIVVVLLVLWLLGVVTSYTLGGMLHILLVIAIIFLLIRVIRGGTL
jgi:hypothetical protein